MWSHAKNLDLRNNYELLRKMNKNKLRCTASLKLAARLDYFMYIAQMLVSSLFQPTSIMLVYLLGSFLVAFDYPCHGKCNSTMCKSSFTLWKIHRWRKSDVAHESVLLNFMYSQWADETSNNSLLWCPLPVAQNKPQRNRNITGYIQKSIHYFTEGLNCFCTEVSQNKIPFHFRQSMINNKCCQQISRNSKPSPHYSIFNSDKTCYEAIFIKWSSALHKQPSE